MFTNAKYNKDAFTGNISSITVNINEVTSTVPIDAMNGDYNSIMRLVESGELVVADPE
jgi:hypothetical protein